MPELLASPPVLMVPVTLNTGVLKVIIGDSKIISFLAKIVRVSVSNDEVWSVNPNLLLPPV